MMASAAPPPLPSSWLRARAALEAHFDRAAFAQWAALTSPEAQVSRIRRTVRAGREAMRALLLSWLPADMGGLSLLDAGCGTGALAVEAARRGAAVTAVDLSARLLELARARAPAGVAVDWRIGDMLELSAAAGGDGAAFDHVVAMDSLVHYAPEDMVRALAALGASARHSVLFTFAPATPLLAAMHAAGLLFPRADRAPAIRPVAGARLSRAIGRALPGWRVGRRRRIASGFYVSEAMELVAP